MANKAPVVKVESTEAVNPAPVVETQPEPTTSPVVVEPVTESAPTRVTSYQNVGANPLVIGDITFKPMQSIEITSGALSSKDAQRFNNALALGLLVKV